MNRILVTGATGFIGRHLCRLLHEQGYAIRGTLRKGAPPADFPVPIEWVEVGEIGPDTDWDIALADMDYVIHLAALAHQIGSNSRSDTRYLQVNTEGTRRLAEAVVGSPRISRLLYVSSIGAVASFSEKPVTESTPCQPDTAYGQSKRAAELAIAETLRDSRSDWCVIRPPLVYGPGNPGNMARLLKLIGYGIPLPFAAIRNQRSFVFVGNLVDALELCLTHPGASRRIFAVSDGSDLSTPQLMHCLSRYTKKPLRLFPLPVNLLTLLGKMGDIISRLAKRSTGIDTYSVARLTGSLTVDITSLQAATGWQPPFSVAEGLELTLQKNNEHTEELRL